jgi:predicted transcriptional regulator
MINEGTKKCDYANVLNAIHDPGGRDLFDSIAIDRSRNETIDYTVKISRKQYYSRLSKLVKTDLIKRKGAKYVLTPFGGVIYAVQLEFTEAVDEHMESKGEIPIIIN